MVKYDYTGAAALYKRFYDLCVDPFTDTDAIQEDRRLFMRELTRGGDMKIWIDYINESLDDLRPVETAKSRVYDFEFMNQFRQLITDIKAFRG